MASPTGDVIDCNFLLLSLPFEHKIRKPLNFGDISEMPYLSNA